MGNVLNNQFPCMYNIEMDPREETTSRAGTSGFWKSRAVMSKEPEKSLEGFPNREPQSRRRRATVRMETAISTGTIDEQMIRIPGGTFIMGSDRHYPEEAPAHPVRVSGFWMDRFPVTNAQFRGFVDATGHVTAAERAPNPEACPGADPDLLVAGSVVFRPPRTRARSHHDWWAYLPGADWRHPFGPESGIEGLDRHPVVNVAYADARAYARWAGKSLPTEAQWEFAARGGLDGADYVWGNELAPEGRSMANIWKGDFPVRNLKPDDPGPTEVGSFPPNGFGLHDMAGNVWEWTRDWYRPGHRVSGGACCPVDPAGPESGRADPSAPDIPMRVIKGGSFLCARNYCALSARRPFQPGGRHVGLPYRISMRAQ